MSVLACALDGGGPAHTCGAAGREHEQRHSARRRRTDVRCVRPSKRNIELGSCGNMSYEGMGVGGMERLVREKSDRRGVFIRCSRAKPATRISDARRIVDSDATFFCPPLQGTTGLPHGVVVTRPPPNRPRLIHHIIPRRRAGAGQGLLYAVEIRILRFRGYCIGLVRSMSLLCSCVTRHAHPRGHQRRSWSGIWVASCLPSGIGKAGFERLRRVSVGVVTAGHADGERSDGA